MDKLKLPLCVSERTQHLNNLLVVLFALTATILLTTLTEPIVQFVADLIPTSTHDAAQSYAASLVPLTFYIMVSVSFFQFFLFLGWAASTKHVNKTMPKKLPFVSIIIPGYNEQETMSKSIEAALEQDYPYYEVIVVDDGSKDFTPFLIHHPDVQSISLP